MNWQEVYNKLSDDLINAFYKYSSSLKLTKSFKAIVTEKISNNIYKVLYKNTEYKAKSYFDLVVDDLVWICVPDNDWDSLFVQSYSGFHDRVITTDKVVNNYSTNIPGTVLDGRMGKAIKTEIDGVKESLANTNNNLSNKADKSDLIIIPLSPNYDLNYFSNVLYKDFYRKGNEVHISCWVTSTTNVGIRVDPYTIFSNIPTPVATKYFTGYCVDGLGRPLSTVGMYASALGRIDVHFTAQNTERANIVFDVTYRIA